MPGVTGITRCLIVDDHEAIREGVGSILAHAEGIESVGSANDGESAVFASAMLHPDVILMDVRMDGIDGFEATRRILKRQPKVGVCLYTAFREAGMLTEGLGCGARGYVLKSTPANAIIAAIRQIAGGGLYVDAVLAGELVLPQERPPISPREREVLTLLSTGLTNPAISKELYISPETVRTHITNAMHKLSARTRTEAVALALGHGLIGVP